MPKKIINSRHLKSEKCFTALFFGPRVRHALRKGVGGGGNVRNVTAFFKGQRWFRSPSVIISAGADGSYMSTSPAQPIFSVPGPHLQL